MVGLLENKPMQLSLHAVCDICCIQPWNVGHLNAKCRGLFEVYSWD